MPPYRIAAYRREILRLREVYGDRIRILLGIECDSYSHIRPERYDYVIGSVHELRLGRARISVDESAAAFRRDVQRYFGGDPYAVCEFYFARVAQVVERTGADIIGHFDLVTKFNSSGELFDESHPRYIRAWQTAADALLKTGKPFEINVGAISRGYQAKPYPMPQVLSYLRDRGAKFLLSGDSHSTDGIAFQFDRWETHLRAMGIDLIEWP